MLKTIVDFVNSLWLDIAGQRWIKRLIGPLIPEIGYLNLSSPSHRFYLALQDMKGPSFHLLDQRYAGFENYEKELRADLLELLPTNGVLVDVGANVGIISFSTAWARPEGRVYAFEPEPLNFQILSKTKLHNDTRNIDLLPMGLSDSAELKTFYLDTANHGGHSLDRGQVSNTSVASSIYVSTLDLMERSLKLDRLDVIKIDVQGLEVEVLRGARASLEKHRPSLIVEFMFNEAFNENLLGFLETLSVTYQFKEPGEKNMRPLSQLREAVALKKKHGYFYGDFIFVATNS